MRVFKQRWRDVVTCSKQTNTVRFSLVPFFGWGARANYCFWVFCAEIQMTTHKARL